MHLAAEIKLNSEMHLEAGSSEFGDALEAQIKFNSEMPHGGGNRASFGEALGGPDGANLEAVISRVWRCTWRSGLSELRDALGGCGRGNLEMHFGGPDGVTQRSIWRP